MRFVSTRQQCDDVDLVTALASGLAPDGGLFVPHQFPTTSPAAFDHAESPAQVGALLLAPFFAESTLADTLPEILEQSLDFPLPVVSTGIEGLDILQLFHGPTAAFKDVGARFLAGCLSRLPEADRRGLTVLVATSGDTGGAVAAAFEGSRVQVAVLYPRDMVSPRQEQQLCCWNDPIQTYRIAGSFDDCQQLVKSAFVDPELRSSLKLTSANSISIGRLLPQMVYYAHSALGLWRRTGHKANFVIPTGNLGNALGCIWARHLGLPIDRIVFASNANRVIPRYLETGKWQPGESIPTLASAMDVGNPSNMERLRYLLPQARDLSHDVAAFSVSDEEIRETIRWTWETANLAVCPHTATALKAWRRLRANGDNRAWIVVSTAHPAKFDQIVEAQTGEPVPIPPTLAALLERQQQRIDLGPELAEFRIALLDRFSQR